MAALARASSICASRLIARTYVDLRLRTETRAASKRSNRIAADGADRADLRNGEPRSFGALYRHRQCVITASKVDHGGDPSSDSPLAAFEFAVVEQAFDVGDFGQSSPTKVDELTNG